MTGEVGTVDRERLEELLGGPELAWLRARIRARLEVGGAPTGTATLREPGPEEREAVDRLLGRRPTSGATLTVRLDDLDERLRRARICDGLAAAVVALDGPVDPRHVLAAAEASAWAETADQLERRLPDAPWARAWFVELVGRGLLRRLAGDAAHARRLVDETLDVLEALPADGVGRERLAATVLGDSHGLDDDRPTATLVLKALQHRRDGGEGGRPLPTAGEERRALWASAGVLLSELTGPVLVLNVPAAGCGSTDAVLSACSRSGEPARLTLRQIVRSPADLSPLRGVRVFVCENPAVVAAAADGLGVDCAPLVCVEGQPSSAVQTLLSQLREAGAELYYHGDFDWSGVRIAGLMMSRFGARPWRFGADDYRRAPAGSPLLGQPVATPWDVRLADDMVVRQVTVHEEQVIGTLLDDLAGGR